ncbi:hypothetical protein CAAN3_10S03796 [[Candida] anglica]
MIFPKFKGVYINFAMKKEGLQFDTAVYSMIGGMRLPIDVSSDTVTGPGSSRAGSSGDVIPSGSVSSSLPVKPKSTEAWDNQMEQVRKNPNDIKQWDILFKMLDDHVLENYDPETLVSTLSESFKKFSSDAYLELLSRFPLLTNYWKNFSIFEYKLNGVKASIEVLSKAVDSHPYSISLWADYLSALISELQESTDQQTEIEFIRSQFQLGLKYNGMNFLSHPLWDKLFEFERSLSDGSDDDIFWLFLKVTKIPLYSYAQYYQTFSEINKKFSLEDLFSVEEHPESILNEYLQKFNKETTDDLSVVERHQIIDDYSYKMFSRTQAKVNEKWTYESAITKPEFSLEVEEPKEYENWVTYLDYEIECYNKSKESSESTSNSSAQYKLVVNLFERALVPNCLSGKLWLKYISFLNSSDVDFSTIDSVYDRAIHKYVPMDKNTIRFNYISFLQKSGKHEKAISYLFQLIQLFGGLKPNYPYYQKDDYIKGVEIFLETFSSSVDHEQFEKSLQKFIAEYFNKRKPKEQKGHKKDDVEDAKFDIPDTFQPIVKLWNDDSIVIAVDKHLKFMLMSSSTASIRHFFNKYHQESPLQDCTKFWSFYVQFEGKYQHNMKNLKMVKDYIKTKSQLPKVVVDALLGLNYDIVSANLADVLENNVNNGRSDDTLISYDRDISDSLVVNSSWRKRLAMKSFAVDTSKARGGEDDIYLKYLKSRIGHAGVTIENTPEITNRLSGKWISLDSNKLEVPPFPTFKNVEKASQPIPYPTDL